MGPLNFDDNQVSMLEMIPDLIHISPIVAIDFSKANAVSGSTLHNVNY